MPKRGRAIMLPTIGNQCACSGKAENTALQICINTRRSIDAGQALPHVNRHACGYAGQLVDGLRRAHNVKHAFKAAMRRLALT
jgi:hypothetical protein